MSIRKFLASAALAGSMLLAPVAASAADMAPAIRPLVASADGQIDNLVTLVFVIVTIVAGAVTTVVVTVTQSP